MYHLYPSPHLPLPISYFLLSHDILRQSPRPRSINYCCRGHVCITSLYHLSSSSSPHLPLSPPLSFYPTASASTPPQKFTTASSITVVEDKNHHVFSLPSPLPLDLPPPLLFFSSPAALVLTYSSQPRSLVGQIIVLLHLCCSLLPRYLLLPFLIYSFLLPLLRHHRYLVKVHKHSRTRIIVMSRFSSCSPLLSRLSLSLSLFCSPPSPLYLISPTGHYQHLCQSSWPCTLIVVDLSSFCLLLFSPLPRSITVRR